MIVQAVADERLPGVLVRGIDVTGDRGHVTVWRAEAGEAWVPVRSGFPARISNGEAVAYDLEVEPGKRYSYRIGDAFAPVDVPIFALPGSGWIKPILAPGLTSRVAFGLPGDVSREDRWSSVQVMGSAAPHVAWDDPGADEWPAVAHWYSEAGVRRFRDALASGPLLIQTDPAVHGLWRSAYAVAKGVGVHQYRDRAIYTVSFTLSQVDRPWPGEAPLRIPGWSWRDAIRDAATIRQVAGRYPTRWDLLLAGTRAARSA